MIGRLSSVRTASSLPQLLRLQPQDRPSLSLVRTNCLLPSEDASGVTLILSLSGLVGWLELRTRTERHSTKLDIPGKAARGHGRAVRNPDRTKPDLCHKVWLGQTAR